MLFLLQFHFDALPETWRVLHDLTEIRFLSFENADGTDAITRFRAVAGVDGLLASWHSRTSVLARCQERKPDEDEEESD